jgi:hypothetical protein
MPRGKKKVVTEKTNKKLAISLKRALIALSKANSALAKVEKLVGVAQRAS